MPRNRRRLIGAAAIAASAALALTACGSSSSGSAGSGGVVKLTMLTGFTGSDLPSYQALVKQFNEAHPDIQVTMTTEPWATVAQKLPASWATGQGPDLATPASDPSSIFHYSTPTRCSRWTTRWARPTTRSTPAPGRPR
jgi:ABC-type glycerol-3-phosphate transport system substrate-binding protein